MNRDVVIVGAGPAGLFTSINIQNRDVVILEEHSSVGRPKHCAGIVGREISQVIKNISPKLLDGAYRRVVFQVESEIIDLEFRDTIAYHVDRPGLEEKLAEICESKGHTILYKTRAKPGSLGVVKTNRDIIKYNVLVVADGAHSVFRKAYTSHREDFIYGLQVVTRNPSIPPDTIHVYYSRDIPGFFAWFTPLRDDYLQIGLASKLVNEIILHKVTKKALGVELKNILDRYGGLIPMHKPLRSPILWSKVIFHGDAVPLTKPYTGGGLYHIFKLSPLLGNLIDMNKISHYNNVYTRSFYIRTMIEHNVTKILRMTKYHIPVRIIESLYRISMIDHRDFDNHYLILIKAIPITPLIPFFSALQDIV